MTRKYFCRRCKKHISKEQTRGIGLCRECLYRDYYEKQKEQKLGKKQTESSAVQEKTPMKRSELPT